MQGNRLTTGICKFICYYFKPIYSLSHCLPVFILYLIVTYFCLLLFGLFGIIIAILPFCNNILRYLDVDFRSLNSKYSVISFVLFGSMQKAKIFLLISSIFSIVPTWVATWVVLPKSNLLNGIVTTNKFFPNSNTSLP